MRAACRKHWRLVLLSASSVAAGCGGTTAAPPPPKLGSGVAAQIVTLAQRVEADTNSCAARNDIAALNAKVNELIGSGAVAVRLRAPLLAGVAALTADAPACAPTPAKPGKGPKPGHGPNPPKPGHGHGDGNDQGND